MKSSVKQFLADLYEIDPTLKAHEKDLLPLLQKLIAEDPATAPDDAFVQRLRMQLRERAAAQPSRTVWQKFHYLFTGAATAAIIIPVAVIITNQQPLSPSAPLFSNSVQATGKNAFGSLNDLAVGSVAVDQSARNFRPQSGGGGPELSTSNAVAPAPAMDAKMIAPWPQITYDYVFSGAIVDLQSTVSVYKRDFKPMNVPMSTLADHLNLGGLNVGSFDGMNIDSVSFIQKTPYGYQMYVNMRDSSINIDANYEQWPQSQCQTDACYQAQRVKIGDVPSDDALIAIARSFADAHGIDLSVYGDPKVDNAWKNDYERVTDKSLAYIPDQIRVIFPQLIDGKPVFDQSGVETGLSITVHVKEKKVMSVYGLGDHSYLKSDYAGVTDEAAIRKYLSTVDNYNYMPLAASDSNVGSDTAKKVTIVLGTPTVSYATYYRYTANRNDELLIPSLVFPVDHVEGDKTENMYYRTQIVVPLSQDILDEMSKRPDVMPMLREQGMKEDAAVSNP